MIQTEQNRMKELHREYQLAGMTRGEEYIHLVEMVLAKKISRSKILVVGSGSGGEAAAYCRAGGNVISIDIDINNALMTKRRIESINKESIVLQADALNLPFLEGSFDLVFMMDVIEHIIDPQGAIEEIARIIKPGGAFVLNSANRYSIHSLGPDPHYKLAGLMLMPKKIAKYYVTKVRKISAVYDVENFPTRSWIRKIFFKNGLSYENASLEQTKIESKDKINSGEKIHSNWKRKIFFVLNFLGGGKIVPILIDCFFNLKACFVQSQVIIGKKDRMFGMKKNILIKILDKYGAMPYHVGKWRLADAISNMFVLKGQYSAERYGIKWKLDLEDIVQRRIFFGIYELNEKKVFEAKVSSGDIIFDVGANIGFYSLIGSKRIGESGKIFSFEPVSEVYNKLCGNIERNSFKNIYPQKAALSDKAGIGYMSEHMEGNAGWGHLTENNVSENKVETTTLDLFVERENIKKIDFIKVDIEGGELRFLDGAARSISRFKPRIMMEVNPSALRRNNASAEDLIRKMKQLGYTIYKIDKKGLSLFDGQAINESLNIFADIKE